VLKGPVHNPSKQEVLNGKLLGFITGTGVLKARKYGPVRRERNKARRWFVGLAKRGKPRRGEQEIREKGGKSKTKMSYPASSLSRPLKDDNEIACRLQVKKN